MQTTGYGNQPIDTQTGRTMVYCFGLFSILLFGGVLISAGSVTTAIFDDALMRFRLKALTLPWVACLFWGSVYYLWMLVIANVRTCGVSIHFVLLILFEWEVL